MECWSTGANTFRILDLVSRLLCFVGFSITNPKSEIQNECPVF